jgi:hypothetical protein
VACLGTLQNVQSDKFMGPLLAALSGGTGKYEFSDYSLTITMPASTVTRQYALHYHLLATHKYVSSRTHRTTRHTAHDTTRTHDTHDQLPDIMLPSDLRKSLKTSPPLLTSRKP